MASPESVRRHNLSLLLRLLHQSGALSRSEIGGALGMTRSTIGELVADLRARGLVEEGDPARLGAPGRPSLVARPNPEGAAAITAEIAVNSLSAAVVGLGGRILHLARVTASAAPPRRRSDDRGCRHAHPDGAGCDPSRVLGRRPRHRRRRASSAGPTGWCTSRRTSAGAMCRSDVWSPSDWDPSLPVRHRQRGGPRRPGRAHLGSGRRCRPPRSMSRARSASAPASSSTAGRWSVPPVAPARWATSR